MSVKTDIWILLKTDFRVKNPEEQFCKKQSVIQTKISLHILPKPVWLDPEVSRLVSVRSVRKTQTSFQFVFQVTSHIKEISDLHCTVCMTGLLHGRKSLFMSFLLNELLWVLI